MTNRVIHRAARIPLYRAGGGAVDNATPQGSTYPSAFPVQSIGATSAFAEKRVCAG